MKSLRRLLRCFPFLNWTLLGLIATTVPPIEASAGEKKEEKAAGAEFRSLLNGQDLSGWTTEGNWLVEPGGILAIQPRPGEEGWKRYGAYLWADKQYGDFVLELEYKHSEQGNSGVFFRVGDTADPVATGMEVQILDSHGKPDPLTHHDCGGIIKTAAPSKNMAKPAGDWNRLILTCKGLRVKVELNGEEIIDTELADSPAATRPRRGALGLQDHGVPLWFRNVRIKEL